MTTSSPTAPAPDEWAVQAGAVLTATPSIATHADAHDAVFDTTIDGHRAWVLLPDGPDSAPDMPAHEAGDLRPPSTMDTRLLAAFTGRLGMSPWGYVTRPRTGESWVRRLVVQFDERVPRGPMADALGRWGRLLTLWLEVWTGQSLDEHNVPTAGPMPPMGIVHLGDDGVVGPGPYMMQVVIEPQHDVERAAYRADWAKAVDLAAQGREPPTEYRLLRDAVMYLRRGERRLAVLNAGTAVEVAWASWLTTERVRVPKNKNLERLLKDVTAHDPDVWEEFGLEKSDVRRTIADLRNEAAHDAYVPTSEEAIAAVDLADDLVRQFTPLPDDLGRPRMVGMAGSFYGSAYSLSIGRP